MDDSRAMRSGVQTREILMTMHQRQRNPVPPAQPDPPDNLPADLAALSDADLRTLRLIWGSRWGAVPGLRSADLLRLLIAWRLQADAEGDLTERARRRAQELADDAEVRVMAPRGSVCPEPAGRPASRDPRLPAPGAVLVREYKGRVLRVLVTEDGFEWGGQRYASLSAVARAVTGSHLNGFRFFRLEAAP